MDDAHGSQKRSDEDRAVALRALAREERPRGHARRWPALEEGVRAFGGEHDLLLAVHQRWQTNLLARLDQALEHGSGDPHGEVLRAVAEQSRAMPGFAALLNEHAADPALARARQRLTGYVDRACTCGRPHPLVAPGRSRRAAPCPLRRAVAVVRRGGGRTNMRSAPCRFGRHAPRPA
jgi:hypothetical protein